MQERYIITIISNEGKPFYASNTSPVTWTSNITFAKQFSNLDSARFDIMQNEGVFKASFISKIYIDKVLIMEQIHERYEFLW